LTDDVHAPIFNGELTQDSFPSKRLSQRYSSYNKQSFRFPWRESDVGLGYFLRVLTKETVISWFWRVETVNPITAINHGRVGAPHVGDDKLYFNFHPMHEIIDAEASAKGAHGHQSYSDNWPVSRNKFLTRQVNLVSQKIVLSGGSPPERASETSDNDRGKSSESATVVIRGFDDLPENGKRDVMGGALSCVGIFVLAAILAVNGDKKRNRSSRHEDQKNTDHEHKEPMS
jgi:hypothetical protein